MSWAFPLMAGPAAGVVPECRAPNGQSGLTSTATLDEPVLVPICMNCERVRLGTSGEYLSLDLAREIGRVPEWFEFTHGICPACEAKAVAKLSPAQRAIWLENKFKGADV